MPSPELKPQVEKHARIKVGLYTYGSPRVGNGNFVELFNQHVPNAFRTVVDGDVVSGVPPRTSGYKHVGTNVVIDGLGSGTIIVDPSFIERQFKNSSRNSIKSHFLTVYRAGLLGVKECSLEYQNQCMINKSHSTTFNSKLDYHSSRMIDNNLNNANYDEGISRSSSRVLDNEAVSDYERRMERAMPQSSDSRPMMVNIRSLIGSVRSISTSNDNYNDFENSSVDATDKGSVNIKLSRPVTVSQINLEDEV